MNIGALAWVTGTTAETIRYYEKIGLLGPAIRSAGNDRKIADLTSLRQELAIMLDACNGGTVAECRILEALSHEHSSG